MERAVKGDFFSGLPVAELVVKLSLVVPAVEDRFGKAQLAGPVLTFPDDLSPEAAVAVLRQDDDAADHHPGIVERVQAGGGNGEVVIEENDVFCLRAVVFIELFPERDVVLLCHRLDADVVCAGLLPGLGRA